MIKINLLPSEIHAAEVRKQLTILGGVAAGAVVCSFLVILGLRFARAKALERNLQAANEELTKYQAIVERVNQLEQTRDQLRIRRDVIKQLLQGRITYPKFFEDFMTILPAEIWIGSLATSMGPQGGPVTVNVGAQSVSSFGIADWVSQLQTSPYFSGVELGAINAQETEGGRQPLLSFSISFRYTRGDV